jgi:hypothetical protein
MVYQQEGRYYAKDSKGNLICVDSSTGCLQEGINYGSHIYVKGIFDLPSPINITSGKVIYIDGYISSINITDYASDIEVIGIGKRDYHVGNLYIDGGAARHAFRNLFINNTTIRFGGHILFDSCTFKYINLHGYEPGQTAHWITFLRSWIQNPDGNGVDMRKAEHILFISSVIAYNRGIGVNIGESWNIKFINSILEGNQTGIAVAVSDVVLEETLVYANRDYGIYIGDFAIVIIRDHSDVRASSKGIDILIDFPGSTLMIDRISIIDSIRGLDKLTYFRSDNPSYLSKNTGRATIPAGATSVTVNHGLICTPAKVLATPLAQPPGSIWVSNITSSQFTINTSTPPSTDLPIAWYAEC